MARKIKFAGMVGGPGKRGKRKSVKRKKISADDVFKYINKGLEYASSPLVSSVVQAIGGAMEPSEEDIIEEQLDEGKGVGLLQRMADVGALKTPVPAKPTDPKQAAAAAELEGEGGWDPARASSVNPAGAYGDKAWWLKHGHLGDGTWKTGPAGTTDPRLAAALEEMVVADLEASERVQLQKELPAIPQAGVVAGRELIEPKAAPYAAAGPKTIAIPENVQKAVRRTRYAAMPDAFPDRDDASLEAELLQLHDAGPWESLPDVSEDPKIISKTDFNTEQDFNAHKNKLINELNRRRFATPPTDAAAAITDDEAARAAIAKGAKMGGGAGPEGDYSRLPVMTKFDQPTTFNPAMIAALKQDLASQPTAAFESLDQLLQFQPGTQPAPISSSTATKTPPAEEKGPTLLAGAEAAEIRPPTGVFEAGRSAAQAAAKTPGKLALPPLTDAKGLPDVSKIASLALSNQGAETLRLAGVAEPMITKFQQLARTIAEPVPNFEDLFPSVAAAAPREVLPSVLPGSWEELYTLAPRVTSPKEQQRLVAHAKKHLGGRAKNIWEAIASIGGDTPEKTARLKTLIGQFPKQRTQKDVWSERKKELDVATAKLKYTQLIDKARTNKAKAQAKLIKDYESIRGQQARTAKGAAAAAKAMRKLLRSSLTRSAKRSMRSNNPDPLLKNLKSQNNAALAKSRTDLSRLGQVMTDLDGKADALSERSYQLDDVITAKRTELETLAGQKPKVIKRNKTNPTYNTWKQKMANLNRSLETVLKAKIKAESELAGIETKIKQVSLRQAQKQQEMTMHQNYANEAASILGVHNKKDRYNQATGLLRRIKGR